jgi:hypothetical protein
VEAVENWFHRNKGQGAVFLSPGSALSGRQTVRFRRNTFDKNENTAGGGGAISIFDPLTNSPTDAQPHPVTSPPSRFEFAFDQFRGNRGSAGAIFARLLNADGMSIVGGIFERNIGDTGGGAIIWTEKSVDVSHSVFVGNAAPEGAAILGLYPTTDAHWRISNSIFTSNVAGPGGGIVAAGAVEMTNVTIARNDGVGYVGDVLRSRPNLPTIANSILSENSHGNCRGIDADRFRGPNLQFGANDCAGATTVDPLLDAMLFPEPGSPVLAMGDVVICRSDPVDGKDFLFEPRGEAGECAIGAFESAPDRRISKLARSPR